MTCDYSKAVSHSTMGPSDSQLRGRNGFTGGTGSQGTFAAASSLSFSSLFYPDADAWGTNFSAAVSSWYPKPNGDPDPQWAVNWWGHVGTYGHCSESTFSYHQVGRAFDLARVTFNNGQFIDMNWSWRQGLTDKRRYLAVAAYLRRRFHNVLTWGYNADHEDHIHFDNGVDADTLSHDSDVDKAIIKMACNYLNGASLDINNGLWTDTTTTELNSLKRALGMGCYDLQGNLSHFKT